MKPRYDIIDNGAVCGCVSRIQRRHYTPLNSATASCLNCCIKHWRRRLLTEVHLMPNAAENATISAWTVDYKRPPPEDGSCHSRCLKSFHRTSIRPCYPRKGQSMLGETHPMAALAWAGHNYGDFLSDLCRNPLSRRRQPICNIIYDIGFNSKSSRSSSIDKTAP